MGFLGFFSRWSLIAGRLPGRTDNEIKNYWNTHIRRKLLNRGIDPATHRLINEAAQDVSTISFTASAVYKEEEKPAGGFEGKDAKSPVHERCPDLNLELKISPPSQNQPEPLRTGGGSLCFVCSLGLQNSKDCSCRIAGIGSTSGSNGSGYDFLGLKGGVLDYRSLETK